jgi:hypothetical protein
MRSRGGLIGRNVTPTADVAPGVWTLRESEQQTRDFLRAQGTDLLFAQVQLLLHMDGSGSTFIDSSGSPKTVTAVGGATQSTLQSKFGGSSFQVGAGRHLSVNGGFNFGTGDFCVELWAYPTETPNGSGLITNSYVDDSVVGFALAFTSGSTLGTAGGSNLFFGWYNAGWLGISTSSTLNLNAWNHIAVSRASNTARLFLNGTQVGSSLTTPQLPEMETLWIGRKWDDNATSPSFIGYIDEVRITKGSARYTSNFTPSATMFPNA